MNPTTTYCQTCGGILQQTSIIHTTATPNPVFATTSTTTALSTSTSSITLPYQNFCSCYRVDVSPSVLSMSPTHTMRRFVLEFEEFCDKDEIWYPARQEGCVSTDDDVFVFDYKLPLPANAEDQGCRSEHFSSYKRMITIYDRRPFIRDVQVHWIDL